MLEVPTPIQTRRLRIIDDGSFEEIALVAVGILESIEVFVGVVDGFRIERIHIDHGEALVREPLRVSFGRLAVDTGDAITEYVLPPLNFLFHGFCHHLADDGFVENSREFFLYLTEEIGEDSDMRELVPPDIADHATGREHLHIVSERVEEGEAIVEIERLEEEIRDHRAEKCLVRG